VQYFIVKSGDSQKVVTRVNDYIKEGVEAPRRHFNFNDAFNNRKLYELRIRPSHCQGVIRINIGTKKTRGQK
jgi:hypothetical protein